MGTRNAVRPLDEEEERRLLRRLDAGDREARRRLIEANLGIVSALARRYAKRWGCRWRTSYKRAPWRWCGRWTIIIPTGG